jgi:hypothetical protein
LTPDVFLEEVYALARANRIDAAADRVFDHIDRLLCDGDFAAVDAIVARVDVARLPTSLMRSFLTITAAAKTHLPSRPGLYDTIKDEMTRLRGADATKRIIGNLK